MSWASPVTRPGCSPRARRATSRRCAARVNMYVGILPAETGLHELLGDCVCCRHATPFFAMHSAPFKVHSDRAAPVDQADLLLRSCCRIQTHSALQRKCLVLHLSLPASLAQPGGMRARADCQRPRHLPVVCARGAAPLRARGLPRRRARAARARGHAGALPSRRAQQRARRGGGAAAGRSRGGPRAGRRAARAALRSARGRSGAGCSTRRARAPGGAQCVAVFGAGAAAWAGRGAGALRGCACARRRRPCRGGSERGAARVACGWPMRQGWRVPSCCGS